MSRLLTPLILLVLTGCAQAQTTPEDLVGVWTLTELPDSAYPCEGAPPEIEYDAEGNLEARSGRQIMEGTYSTRSDGEGLWIDQVPVSHNGEPNCQGIPAETVVAQNVPSLYVVIDGDRMEVFTSGPDSPHFVLSRVPGE